MDQKYSKSKGENPLKPILYAFNLMGRIPFVAEESGDLVFKLISIPTIWAFFVTSGQIWLALIIFHWRMTQSKYWAGFDKTLDSLNRLVFITSAFHGPLFSWLDTTEVVRAVNRWNAFQVKFQKIVKKPLTSSLTKYSYLGLLSAVIGLAELVIVSQTNTWVDVLNHIVINVCVIYGTSVVLMWAIYCLSVKSTAKIFKDSLIKEVNSLPSSEVFLKYRLLLAEFQECTTQMTNALSRILHSVLISFFVLVLLSIYGLLMFLFVDHSLDLEYIPESITFRSFCIWMVFSLGHFAQSSMRDDLLYTIYSRKWLYLSESIRSELDLLLDLIEMGKSSFETKGLFVIDRLELLPIVQMIITYVVVMMQLKGLTDTKEYRE